MSVLIQGDFIALGRILIRDLDPVYFQRLDPDPDKIERIR
jgi:hypothetical protein